MVSNQNRRCATTLGSPSPPSCWQAAQLGAVCGCIELHKPRECLPLSPHPRHIFIIISIIIFLCIIIIIMQLISVFSSALSTKSTFLAFSQLLCHFPPATATAGDGDGDAAGDGDGASLQHM